MTVKEAILPVGTRRVKKFQGPLVREPINTNKQFNTNLNLNEFRLSKKPQKYYFRV